MSFPGEKTRDPWKVAPAVANATFVQDVVIATTRLLREGKLEERERTALGRCRGLLLRVERGAAQERDPEGSALEPSESPVLLRAARSALKEDHATFAQTLVVLDRVLEGAKPRKQDLALLEALRQAFLAIGRANLKSIDAARQAEADLGLWDPLMTSLRS